MLKHSAADLQAAASAADLSKLEEWRNGGMEAWRECWRNGGSVAEGLAGCVKSSFGSLWQLVGVCGRVAPGSPREPQGAPGSPREPQGGPRGAPGSSRELQGGRGRARKFGALWWAVPPCAALCRPVPACGGGLGSPKQGMLQPGVLQPGSLKCCSLAEWSGLEGMLHAVGGVGLDWRLAVFSDARCSERYAEYLYDLPAVALCIGALLLRRWTWIFFVAYLGGLSLRQVL